MLPIFILAAVLTGILALVALASIVGGTVFFWIPRLRSLAPWMLFPPSLAALGAAGGAWGLGYLAVRGAGSSPLPFWAWIGGLLAGGASGALLGVLLAWLCRRRGSP
jgi:hypothetical protein